MSLEVLENISKHDMQWRCLCTTKDDYSTFLNEVDCKREYCTIDNKWLNTAHRQHTKELIQFSFTFRQYESFTDMLAEHKCKTCGLLYWRIIPNNMS